jgi:hypothetical protein
MEAVIQRKIKAMQQFIKVHPEADDSTTSSVTKKHFEMEIDILRCS